MILPPMILLFPLFRRNRATHKTRHVVQECAGDRWSPCDDPHGDVRPLPEALRLVPHGADVLEDQLGGAAVAGAGGEGLPQVAPDPRRQAHGSSPSRREPVRTVFAIPRLSEHRPPVPRLTPAAYVL